MRRHRGATSAGVSPFDRYRRRALRPLDHHTDRVRIEEGTVLSRQGGLARQVVVIVAGEVALTRDGQAVGRAGPGIRIGSADVLGDGTSAVTAVAASALDAVVLPAPAYRWAAQVLPGFVDAA
jgi:CRP-like cAMP-binding protein